MYENKNQKSYIRYDKNMIKIYRVFYDQKIFVIVYFTIRYQFKCFFAFRLNIFTSFIGKGIYF